MAIISSAASASASAAKGAKQKGRGGVQAAQAMAKMKALEKRALKYKLPMGELAIFTQQLASLLVAGLPLVQCLEALQDQTEDQVFQIVIREVRLDISTGNSFSTAVKKFPKSFNTLFCSMVEAGEASGGLAEILGKVAGYFEASVKLNKKVKSAMTYPIAVIGLAVGLVNVLLIFVIPVFANMFADFGAKLPAPTQFLIDLSDFMKGNWYIIIAVCYAAYWLGNKYISTPRGRSQKDHFLVKAPICGNLIHKIALSRFCRTYAP
jgi:type IV pilus assembly protein PilC